MSCFLTCFWGTRQVQLPPWLADLEPPHPPGMGVQHLVSSRPHASLRKPLPLIVSSFLGLGITAPPGPFPPSPAALPAAHLQELRPRHPRAGAAVRCSGRGAVGGGPRVACRRAGPHAPRGRLPALVSWRPLSGENPQPEELAHAIGHAGVDSVMERFVRGEKVQT